jgi:acetoin:2,6-dichlorophenolindophenol oxidoreductase subunit beta
MRMTSSVARSSGIRRAARRLRVAHEDTSVNDVAELDPVVLSELLSDERMIYLHTHPPKEWVTRVGAHRVRACAISEAAMVGIATGAAMRGLRPLVDLNRASFVLCAMDMICNHAAKLHYLSAGQYEVPLTITCAMRGDYHVDAGREHAPYGMFLNVPGLVVAVPGSLADAIGLLRSSLRHNGPVLFFLSPLLHGEALPAASADSAVQIGRARVIRPGTDVTVVAIGAAVKLAKQVMPELAALGLSVELIDPLTLAPLDTRTICQSVRKTRRLVVLEEASGTAAASLAISAHVTGDPDTFAALKAPPAVIRGLPVPLPASQELERAVFPGPGNLLDAVLAVMGGRDPGSRQ